MEILADNNDEAEELFKTTTAENVAENEEISTECCQSSRSIADTCDIPQKSDLINSQMNNDLFTILNPSNIDRSDQLLTCDILRNSGQSDTCDQQCEKIDHNVISYFLLCSLCIICFGHQDCYNYLIGLKVLTIFVHFSFSISISIFIK